MNGSFRNVNSSVESLCKMQRDERRIIDKNNPFDGTDFAIARLQALLLVGRHCLADKLTTKDFYSILDCFLQDFLIPAKVMNMAGALMDHAGASQLTPTVKKVLDLSPLERFALADILEQAWHKQSEHTLFETASRLGMKFKA